jgi:thioesterase domain-containing protein/acyl carrier protein/NADP-dependent 3-hydroxy acid dehydrogenase YdfG
MDVILSGLAGECVDASLRLLPRGGRFLDMGLSDLRDPAQVARDHPGVTYHAVRPAERGLDHVAGMMDELSGMFRAGALQPLPVTGWPLADAPAAVRALATGQNTGKYVLSCPRRIRPGGTVVVTGGTGLVGGLVARHLAAKYGVTSLLLLSRTGPDAPGARQLQADLQAAGVRAAVLACDAGDRDALARALATIPAQHPLSGIVHAAAVLDDCTFESIDPARLRRVLRAKAEAAWHLHELTKDLDLEMFILFSSLAGTVSAPGQASYAAANAYLDALASWRQARGMSGTAIAWGRWETASELTRNLSQADLARMSRGGMLGLSADQGLALFDLAQDIPSAAVAAVRLDLAAMASGPCPALFAALVPQAGAPARQAATNAGPDGSSWKRQLTGRSARERLAAATDLICSQVAVVLGYQKASDIDSARTFGDLGFDSLSSVELRNQLSKVSGTRITPTAVFEHPTPQALARHLIDQLSEGGQEAPAAPGPSGMDRLLRGAVESGQFDRFLAATAQLAAFSPVLPEPGPPRSPVTLSAGEDGQPAVYCLPSLFGKSSYEAFWRLAETLPGELEVNVLTHPGFLDGEALPASAAAVLRTHADTIIRHQPPGRPFVLVGYSSAAAVARALAGQLRLSRLVPLGVVLLDSFSLGSDGLATIAPLLKELIARNEQLGDLGTNWALAMSRYGSFDWPIPADEALPVLLVRATQRAGGAPPAARGLDPQEDNVRVEIVGLDADHLSLLQEKAPETAEAIVAWLQKLKGLGLGPS